MSTKALLALLLSIGWIWFCQHWHCCWIHQSCTVDSIVATTTPPAVTAIESPLTFSWSNERPKRSTEYQSYEDEIFEQLGDDNILEITGQYFSDEITPDNYENMGLARADAIRRMMTGRLPGERMRIKSELIDDREGMRDNDFNSATFNWIITEIDKPEVVELTNKTVILFPFNSASKKTDPGIDAYLDKLAIQLKASKKTVYLTGHTDAIGDDPYNKKLGYKRTRRIRRILIDKGVRRSKIKMDSKGKSEPVAANATEEGRSLNRRVEVVVE